ncbi:hypothetical protein QJQ45_001393 [Haematococcus lacustris]|nr:hypothetical protein QJQ45_001393 [Haematococcus lacustris]
MPTPKLPARKAGGKRVAPTNGGSLPILSAQDLELDDGTRIPVKIPEGDGTPALGRCTAQPSTAQEAQALLEYLKANPEAAKEVFSQAQQVLKNPGMAQAFMNMQVRAEGAAAGQRGQVEGQAAGQAEAPAAAQAAVPAGDQGAAQQPGMADKYQALKDDPDLKHVFDDVVKIGPSAFQKYWDDVDLMAKISAKMRALQVEPSSAPSGLNSGRAPGSAAPLTSLHDAAKAGDEAAVIRLLDAGEKVDGKNERGITALGTAVGFNRVAVVSLLLSRGAEVDARDNQGNTALHYAAGYGRKEVAQLLLQVGADLAAVNKSGLTPCGAAAMNKETGMVSFLVAAAAEGRQGGTLEPAATQPAAPQPACQAAAAPLTPSASPEPDASPQ